MPWQQSRLPWVQQPSGLVLPDTDASFVPEGLWLPQYGPRLWQRDNWDNSSSGMTITEAASPQLLPVPGGQAWTNATQTANTYFTRSVKTIQFPTVIGCVMVPMSRGVGVAWGMGGSTGTGTSGPRFEIGTAVSTGNITCISRMAQSGGINVSPDTGFAPPLEQPIAVAYVERSTTNRSIFYNGIKFDNTTTGSTPATPWAYHTIQTRKCGSGTPTLQFPGYCLMGWYDTGRDPGDQFLLEWTVDPWGMLEPDVIRVFFSGSTAFNVSVTDAGSASDALAALAADLATTDVGAGTEAPSVQASLAVADASAAASDSVSASVLVSTADTGSGADSTPSIAVSVSVAQTGTATEGFTVTASLSLTDAGAGADTSVAGINVALTETGTGVEVVTISNAFSVADANSTTTEALAAAISALVSDTGTAAQVPSVAVSFGLTDAGAGVDTPSGPAASVPVVDTGAGVDVLAPITVSLVVTNTATGTETFAATVTVPLTDVGAAAEAISILTDTLLAVGDSATGAESISIVATTSVGDSAIATEATGIQAVLALLQAASGSDAVSVATDTQVSVPDVGTATSTQTISASMSAADASNVTGDTIALSVSFALADVGTGSEAVSVITETLKSVTDTGLGTDSVGQVNVNLALSDAGTAVELLQIAAILQVLQNASGTDVALRVVSGTKIVRIEITQRKRSAEMSLSQRSAVHTLH